jgi:hypothetical protein
MGRYYTGRFKPKNPTKYRGDPTNIVYRSRWELVVMQKFDDHPDIIEWSSEELVIPYISPVDNKRHRYFPDFFIKRRDKYGVIESILIEVKPLAQTKPPKVLAKPTRRYINEVYTYGVNQSKWAAAEAVCKDRGWKFMVMTEADIGIKF